MPLRLLLAVLLLATPAALASAASTTEVTYRDTLPRRGTGQVTVTTRAAVSFAVRLQVPAGGRARLFLLGATAPRGGPLIDTRTHACRRAGSARVCTAAFEPLPRGSYTWRVAWQGTTRAPVVLTLRW